MKVYEFIEQNIDTVRTFIKIGAIPPHYMNYYNIYCMFRNAKGSNRTNRKYYTGDIMGFSKTTIDKAVRIMEAPLPKVRSSQ